MTRYTRHLIYSITSTSLFFPTTNLKSTKNICTVTTLKIEGKLFTAPVISVKKTHGLEFESKAFPIYFIRFST